MILRKKAAESMRTNIQERQVAGRDLLIIARAPFIKSINVRPALRDGSNSKCS